MYRDGMLPNCSKPFLLFALFCYPTRTMKFWCNYATCMMENIDLDQGYSFAFAYSNNPTYQLTAIHIRGDIFDLTTLPNISSLRDFVLDQSQLNTVIVKLTMEESTVTISNTPLKTIIFHESRNLREVRIDKSLLGSVPETLVAQDLLQTLFITNALLTVIDFNLFETLPNLLYVDFNGNKIHALHIPPASTCCRRLVSLNLQQNRLENFNFGLLALMNCLEIVTLRENRIVKVENVEPIDAKPPNLPQFCTTNALRHDSVSYSRYASLTTIDLDSNRMREVNISMFCTMPNLMELMLSRNLLTSVTVTNGHLPARLEALELNANKLANADLRCDFLVDMGGNYDILVRFRAIASSTARSCLSNSSRRDDFFDAAAFAFSMAALDGGITCAPPPLPSLLFFESV
uniref:Leucine rich immune protein (Coil-less) n=1 Tax=Anopheles maculatus TaxID=74869 RepID=A0A182SBX2_9DIPT